MNLVIIVLISPEFIDHLFRRIWMTDLGLFPRDIHYTRLSVLTKVPASQPAATTATRARWHRLGT